MSVLPVGIAASGDEAYTLDNSLRFRSSASAYLDWTPASAGNRKTWTWSAWVKRGTLGSYQSMFTVFDYASGGATNNQHGIRFDTSDKIEFWNYSGAYAGRKITTQVFRDVSAWYHVVAVWDTSNATASNRMRLYINGSEVTSFSTSSDPAQNTDGNINRAFLHTIGTFYDSDYSSPTHLVDGYLTEINFIDGQALTADDFGEFDSTTGVWKPKAYSGSYGTNGFYLDGSGVTDSSGNGNNWTNNNLNLSTSSATTYDLMTDVPTLTDEDTANYCTLNPLSETSNLSTSEANLAVANSTTESTHRLIRGTMGMSTGKYYWEVNVNNSANVDMVGIINSSYTGTDATTVNASNGFGYGYNTSNGNWYNGTGWTTDGTTPAAFPSSGIIGVAFDADNGKLYFSRNNTWINSANPSAGTGANGTYTGSETEFLPALSIYSNTGTWRVNFGQRPFAYTPPTGFLPLNTYNLPDATIEDGSEYMDTYTSTGTGTTRTAVIAFQPDLVWTKTRNTATNGFNIVQDSVRGEGNRLITDGTYAEGYDATYGSFTSTGFQFGSNLNVNTSGNTYVDWLWKANGSGVSNTVGDTNATVSANTTSGFSIVSFNAGAAGNHTVGHGLGVTPEMIIMKDRDSSGYGNWTVFHSAVCTSTSNYLLLNGTGGLGSVANSWGSALPTSTVFGFGSNVNVAANDNIISYCFAPVEGFSAFGSYTGNGSTDGPFIYTGFRPAFIMFKVTSTTNIWIIHDTARDTYNVSGSSLLPNASDAEYSNNQNMDIVSNGFKLRSTDSATNASGQTYIYAAFAENPFKNSLAR